MDKNKLNQVLEYKGFKYDYSLLFRRQDPLTFQSMEDVFKYRATVHAENEFHRAIIDVLEYFEKHMKGLL